MAIGDITPKALIRKALSATATDSQYTTPASTRTIVTSVGVKLQTSGATARTVTVYVAGTAEANEIFVFSLSPSGVKADIINGLDIVLTAGQTISIKQDVGTDVNVAVMGVEEVIS